MSEPQLSQEQFSLKTLFCWTTLVAISFLPFTLPIPFGVIAFLIGLSVLLVVVGKGVIVERALIAIGIGTFVLTVSFGLFCVAGLAWNYQPRRVVNTAELQSRQIGLALLNYEFQYGHFPPAFTIDEQGKPLHSWRVLILPYLEENELYDEIDLEKPWDDPVNKKFHSQIPEVYRYSSNQRDSSLTSFVGVVGQNTMWRSTGRGCSLDQIAERSGDIILVINSPPFQTNWMQPRDPSYSEFVAAMNNTETEILRQSAGNVILADGSVSYFDADERFEDVIEGISVSEQ